MKSKRFEKPERSKKFLAVLSVITLLGAACGIAEKRAKALLEQESYDEAATAFEKVVASDPENLEARANLTKARQGVVSKRLIDVRKLRQGGSPLGAADLLVSTLAQARAWGVRPPGQAVATEEEEVGFATKYLVGEFETQVKKLQPIATESLIQRYSSLFEEKGKRALQQFSTTARKQGNDLCKKLDRGSFKRKPEYAKLVARVCMHYGMKPSLPGYSEAELLSNRWSSVDLATGIEGLDENQRRGLKLALDHALQEHPLFDAKGRKLNTKAVGNFRLHQQRIPVQLLHTYYVNEQYVTTEMVTKTRLTPVQMPGGAIVNQNVSYQEEVPVTRTRRVARQFPYGGWRIIIDGSLEGSLEPQIENAPSVPHQSTLSEAGDQNDISNPMVGLQPFTPQLRDPKEWISGEFNNWAKKFNSALTDHDRNRHCSEGGGPEDSIRDEEHVQKCVRVMRGAAAPTFVDDWYKAEFGLPRVDFEKVIPL